ncbi:hypothetical protein ACU4GD_21075 [Cupriavidus basilensis]
MARLEDTVGVTLFDLFERPAPATDEPRPARDPAQSMHAPCWPRPIAWKRDMAGFGLHRHQGTSPPAVHPPAHGQSLPDDIAGFLQVPDHRDIRVTVEEQHSRELVRSCGRLRRWSICWMPRISKDSRPGPITA